MLWWKNGDDLKKAIELSERADRQVVIFEKDLKSHIDKCNDYFTRLDTNIEKTHKERQEDANNWRKGLGERLDSQDRLLQKALYTILSVLFMIVVFFVSRLPIFK